MLILTPNDLDFAGHLGVDARNMNPESSNESEGVPQGTCRRLWRRIVKWFSEPIAFPGKTSDIDQGERDYNQEGDRPSASSDERYER